MRPPVSLPGMAEPSRIRLASRARSRSVRPDEADRRAPVERAAGVAARHFGSIGARQLIAAGFSRARIQRWVDAGRLHPRYPGVFAWGRPDLPVAGELAAGLLYAGHGAALAGLSALWWRNLLHRRPDRIHIDAPGGAASRDDLRIRHPRTVDREWHRGLPVAGLAAALGLAAEALSHNSLRLVLARAEYEGILSLAELDAELGRGRRGSAAIRAAINVHLPQLARCVNGFERSFVLLCEGAGLPIPEPNVRIGRYRPDMLWADAMLIVELDGERAHRSPARRHADATKQRYLESLGHRVLRFWRHELRHEPDRCLASVIAALP